MNDRKLSIKRLLLFAAVLLALTCAAELCFCALQNRRGADEYALRAVGADSFDSWEFEARGGGDYYALANNSYFAAEGLGGAPAEKIEVRMTRSASDASTCVMYCTGTVGGVYGDFIVPLTRQADGSYAGYPDCTALDAVKIYPTELVRTVIHFEGVVLNPDAVAAARFSAARCLLWASLFAAAFACVRLARFFLFKKGARPSLWGCVFALLCALLLTAVFAATRIYTATRGLESLLLPAAFAAFLLLYLAVWGIAVRLKTAAARAAAAALLLGVLFSFANAPLQAPDEHGHFLRAFALSQGSFVYDYDYDYPNDVRNFVAVFSAELGNYKQDGGAGAADRVLSYLRDPYAPGAENCRTSVQLLLPYALPALGMALARLFGANALFCLYAGRLMNALAYAACVYFAVRLAKRHRGALLFAALLPMGLYMAASLSYDSLFLGAAIVFLGFMFKEDFSARDALLAALAFGVVIMIKPIYFPLALLVFAIPREALRFRRPRAITLLALCAAGAALYYLTLGYASLFARGIPPSYVPEGVNIAAQIKYVLTHPVRYLVVMLVDGWTNSFYLTTYGLFGWLDVHAPLTCALTPAALVAVAALDTGAERRRGETPLFAATVLLGYALIVTGFYATWSTLGATSILGVQSRYFIPFLPLLCALLSQVFSGALRFDGAPPRRDAVCTALCAALSLLAVAELFTLNYLM